MYVVLVEDDHLQAEWVEARLAEAFEGLDIVRISTESAFYAWLAGVGDDRPRVFIIDVMLRWADPGPGMKERPPEVKKNGFYRAGLRCQESIARNDKVSDIPVILYTVLEHLDLEEKLRRKHPYVTYLRKDSDSEPLIKKLRQFIK